MNTFLLEICHRAQFTSSFRPVLSARELSSYWHVCSRALPQTNDFVALRTKSPFILPLLWSFKFSLHFVCPCLSASTMFVSSESLSKTEFTPNKGLIYWRKLWLSPYSGLKNILSTCKSLSDNCWGGSSQWSLALKFCRDNLRSDWQTQLTVDAVTSVHYQSWQLLCWQTCWPSPLLQPPLVFLLHQKWTSIKHISWRASHFEFTGL